MLRRCERRRVPESGGLNVLHLMPLGPAPGPDLHVCRTMFETESIPGHWAEWLRPVRRVWVPTQFNVESFERGGVDPDRLRILPGTIDFDRFHPGAEPWDLGESRGFTFVSNFDFQDRKGWDVLLRAYALEFAGEEDVTLALKVNTIHASLATIQGRVQAEISSLGIPESRLPHVRVFDDAIPEARLPGFYTAADAYVSPTRGEGWGRPLMEAVACGAPVVASRWSAHLAFLNDGNATLVDGQVVDVPADVDIPVFRGMRWFDPDADALRAALRAVRSDPAGARARAVASRPALVEEFALPAIAERVAELVLEAL
jgi:glycosyltransferase involved in cell wall biosynthesis